MFIFYRLQAGHDIVPAFLPKADEILPWRIQFKMCPPLWRVENWDIFNIFLGLADRLVIWLKEFKICLPFWSEQKLRCDYKLSIPAENSAKMLNITSTKILNVTFVWTLLDVV